MDNKEIELKFVINNEIKNKIIADLKKVAIKTAESRLIDTYYIPYFKDYEINGETMECLRTREKDDKCTLTYKKIHRESSPVYCDEYETKVASKQQLENILFAIGFEVQMVIDKTRVSYKLDNFEFDFDSVKNLGELMEVELTDNNASTKSILNFVAKYGLTSSDVTYEGIQILMKKAMGIK